MSSETLRPLSEKETTGGILPWLPGIVAEGLALLFCILYAVTGGKSAVMYLQVPASALLPFTVPVYNLFSKRPLPIALAAGYTVFVFGASDLGSACGFYDKIPCWDLVMHGLFGFLCCLTIFIFLLRWSGGRLNPVGAMILVFVFTMGVAALWEVWEYNVDRITGGDSQRVEESILLGKSPVADTMEDIMIAMAGCVLFYLFLFFDKRGGYPVSSRLFGFCGFSSPDALTQTAEETSDGCAKETSSPEQGGDGATAKETDATPKRAENPPTPGRYRHFKGNEYEVLGVAHHSETLEEEVVYRALYGEGGLWVRPLANWNTPATRDGQPVERFTYLGAKSTPEGAKDSEQPKETDTE